MSTSSSASSAEKISDVIASAQNTNEVVSDEKVEFTRDLVTYFILLAFFIFGVYYFLTMPEMGLLAGAVIVATIFPVLLRTPYEVKCLAVAL